MDTEKLETQLDDIRSLLETLNTEIEERKRHRLEMEELKDDLTVIAKDMFSSAVKELDDIAPFVSTGDFMHLMKRLLRNTRTITDMMGKLESTVDFAEDAIPIGRELFHDLMLKLDELDRKGYFNLFRSLNTLTGTIAEKLPPEEFQNIIDKVVLPGIELARKLADMNLLPAINRTLNKLDQLDPGTFDNFTMWRTYKETRTINMRRTIGAAIFLLETLTNDIFKQTNKMEVKNA